MPDPIDLNALADELARTAAASRAQRAAHTLLGQAPLRQTLIALAGGAGLAEHESPGHATLQVLRGAVRLHAGEDSWDLPAGSHMRIPERRHSVSTEVDSVLLLTVALPDG